ncbi:MAG: glutamine synthetase adenylyltransferase [Planctomycetales bacterium]
MGKAGDAQARVIAGDFELGQGFLREAQPMIFNSPPEAVRANVKGMKARIEAELEHRGKKWGEVKSGTGSIRDIEFVTQYLQLINGGENPAVRSFNTLNALIRLTDFDLLQADEYRILTDGYIFLRKIEHALQLLHNKQTHNLPTDPQELNYLAMRLDFESGEQFLNHYERYCTAIRRVYDRHFNDYQDREVEATPAHTRVMKHLARMEHDYALAFDEDQISQHARLAQQLDANHLVEVEAEPLEDGTWRVTIIAYDYLGELSLICGLMFVYGLDIVDGDVFTYEAVAEGTSPPKTIGRPKVKSQHRPPSSSRPRNVSSSEESAKKIVDVFTVRPMQPATAETFLLYRNDLHDLLKLLKAGKQTEAQGVLANRVATILRDTPARQTPLYPVDIDIDNAKSEQFTLLRISAPDTIGFLYELSNALALNGVYVQRVHFKALGNHAYDILYVTDQHGRKIIGEREQLELRAATLLTKQFTHLLPRSSNPEGALLHFREFISQLFSRSDWITELSSLTRPEVLDALAQLLGVSDFLWNDFLRMQHANLFPVVKDVEALAERYTPDRLREDLQRELQAAAPGEERVLALNSFKDRVMFRIDMRHILGHIPEFGQFSLELTDAAEVVVEAACDLVETDLKARFGVPQSADALRCPYVVCALGKCGGRELGYASDIELMFVYDGTGLTTGPEKITTTEYYLKLVEAVTHTIRTKHEGIFQVDLRLRPYGKAGPLAVSLEAFRNYFGMSGPAWPYERQALVKLRPICGDLEFGARLVGIRDKLIYSGGVFEVEAMRGMRERQLRQLVTPGTFNAKFSPGGLVDIEYLVQGLQMQHAREYPEIKETNTRLALKAMREAGILSEANFQALTSAYIFLRRLIDALRVVRGDAKDLTVPDHTSEEFQFLSRRLGYGEEVARLPEEIAEHAARVQQINGALLS